MRKLKLGTAKLGDIRDDLQHAIGKDKYTDSDLPEQLWNTFINQAVSEWHELSGAKDSAEYQDRVDFPIVKKVYSNKSTGSSYDGATNILTLPLSGNVLWDNAISFDESWIGGQVLLTDTSSGNDFTGTISEFVETTEEATKIAIMARRECCRCY